ncbi:MAG TPA: hypothetical protein VK528_04875 [Flavobacterium sp.]|nr:hypothetical protein [Flavobacterium sp.]
MENQKNNTDDQKAKDHGEDAVNRDSQGYADDTKYTSEDKYLALEQPGVSYTNAGHPESNSDNFETSNEEDSGKFHQGGVNSRNADAFSQDDYILKDNIDLDEDQSQSISSDDDVDTNTTDEI